MEHNKQILQKIIIMQCNSYVCTLFFMFDIVTLGQADQALVQVNYCCKRKVKYRKQPSRAPVNSTVLTQVPCKEYTLVLLRRELGTRKEPPYLPPLFKGQFYHECTETFYLMFYERKKKCFSNQIFEGKSSRSFYTFIRCFVFCRVAKKMQEFAFYNAQDLSFGNCLADNQHEYNIHYCAFEY